MTANQGIHAFAVKWFDVFRNTKTVNHEVEESTFADECFALGFEMDCGKAFEAAYPASQAFNDYRELDTIIDDIDDIALLGSTLFSKWRYFTHWAGPGADDILSPENRAWFIIALGRLERLTSDSDTSAFIFSGKVQKMQIVSNSIHFGPCPQPNDEVEQHLTITAAGRAFFSSYTYGDGKKYIKSSSQNFKIDASKAKNILNMVEEYFSDEYDVSFATDVGDWEMTLTNEKKTAYHFRGSLCPGDSDVLDSISSFIRSTLNMPELLVFDGCANSDIIEKV